MLFRGVGPVVFSMWFDGNDMVNLVKVSCVCVVILFIEHSSCQVQCIENFVHDKM